MKPLANNQRVNETAEFIRKEMAGWVDPMNIHSLLNTALSERCPAYNNGLTNTEGRLALMRALALMQIDVGEYLANLNYASEFDDDDQAAAA